MPNTHHPALPTISVITPSYNSAAYIERTIASVRLQDYPAAEHIVMDGGSDDGTVEILRRSDHLLWRSEPDGGQSHAVNKAARLACGDVLAWINSDDTYCPGALQGAAEYLAQHPDTDVVVGRCNEIDENDRVTGALTAAPFSLAADLLEHRLPQPSAFIRRTAFVEVGGLDESLSYVMDRDLFLRLGVVHRIDSVDSTWANFRFCRGTKTASYPERFWLETLGVFERFFERDDLPREARAVERQARARALWNAGVLLLAGQEPNELALGAAYCRQAMATYDLVEHDLRFLQEMTTHWAATRRRDDPMSVVEAVLDATRNERERDTRLTRVLTAHIAINEYMGTIRDDPDQGRRITRERLGWLAIALRHDPRWARNVGVWSRLARR